MRTKSFFNKFILLNLFMLTAFSCLSFGQPDSSPSSPSAWSIVASYPIPGKASGLAWDGTYIYFGIYGVAGDQVYKFNPANGSISTQCTGPMDDAYGLTYKSPNLVTVRQPSNSGQPSEAVEFTMAGSQVSAITLPDHYMSGIAYDNGTYWVCTYYPDPSKIYHISSSGAVLSQFVLPYNQPWDVCMQGSDLWIADYWGDMLYKVSSTGTLLESHPSQGTDPAGIVFDGTYLWYCDGGSTSTLYKVNLSGSGTPVINVPTTTHDYGTVTVGNTPSWNCAVQNTGTANLVINSVGIPSGQPITTTFVPPATITPGSSINIPFIYTPLTAGHLNTQVTINSSDPIHPSIAVTLLGDAVISGPYITVEDTAYNWDERRSGSTSRWYLELTNNGDEDLIITDIDLSDTHFYLDEGVDLPLTITPLQTSNIGVWFHPTEGISYSGTMTLTSNDPVQNPFMIYLSGTGISQLYPIGSFLWSYVISGGFDNSPKAIRPIADVTGDGVDDVIVASEDDNIRCLNGNASGTADVIWTTAVYAGAVYQQNAMATIDDINNDGYRDVIAGIAWGDRSITAFSGKTGAQLWKHDTHEYGDGGWVYQVDVKYDYTGDGFPDVLAATGNDGNNTGPKRVYCLDGKTGVSEWEALSEGAVFAVIGVEDFTGDGQPDAVAGATTASETNGRIYGINGANGVIVWTQTPAGSSTWGLMQLDDITGDGIKDVASGDFSGNIYFHNAVNGTKEEITSIPGTLILRFEDMGDVNKDGYRDILVAHSGTKGIILNGHDATQVWSKTLSDKSWNVGNVGDVTWDGVNDAAIGTLYSNNRVYFFNGNTGDELFSGEAPNAIDALSPIPDIVGDNSMELVVGGREGALMCLSGGYDSSTISIPDRDIQTAYSNVMLYPNPCKDLLNIKLFLHRNSDVKITVTDITGRLLFTQRKDNLKDGVQVLQIRRDQVIQKDAIGGIFIVGVTTCEGNNNFRVLFE